MGSHGDHRGVVSVCQDEKYAIVGYSLNCKFHIGQYLRQHGWLPLPITMAVKSLKKVPHIESVTKALQFFATVNFT